MDVCYETGFHYVAQSGLELMTLLPHHSNSGIIGTWHHTRVTPLYLATCLCVALHICSITVELWC